MREDTPFMKWWMTEIGQHHPSESAEESLSTNEASVAIAAWNAAIHALSDVEHPTDLIIKDAQEPDE